MKAGGPLRTIKSYVVRGGRLTEGQQRALDELWPRFGLERGDGVLDQRKVFEREAPLVLEIGFGMGEALAAMAAGRPDLDFIGVDVHPPGIGSLLRSIDERELNNVRVYRDDVHLVLGECIADAMLSRVQIYFPDPWPKKRHQKRRLIQPAFVELLGQKLAPGGVLHLATDWENYAEQMMDVLGGSAQFENCAGAGNFSDAGARPVTKFQRRGERLGHGVWDLRFQKYQGIAD